MSNIFKDEISSGLLHCHTEHSFMDSTLTPTKLVERASELGAKAVELSDHGTMTAVDEFRKACRDKGIKPLIGLEAYMEEDEETFRRHLILVAKDHIGEVAIGKFCTQTNTRLKKVGKLRFPRGNKALIEEFFGEGKPGHGHVIARSACMGGILIGLFLQNEKNAKELPELEKNIRFYTDTKKAIEANEKALAESKKMIKELKEIADKKYKAREKFLSKIKDTSEYDLELEKLNREKQESEQAQENVKKLRFQISAIQKKITALKKELPSDSTIVEKRLARYEWLKQNILSETQLIEKMEEEAAYYDKTFGHGNFFIEIQNHGINTEIRYMHTLVDIAEKLDIPYVAANDVHMACKEDFEARQTIKLFRFQQKKGKDDEIVKIPKPEIDASEKELYIKTDSELFEAIAQAIGEERAQTAITNIGKMTDACLDEIIEEKHYPVFKKEADANQLLRKMVYDAIPKRFAKEQWTKEYQDRLEYELSIICKMGYADYHLIDQDFINFAKKLGYMPEERYQYLVEHIDEMSYEEMVSYVEEDQSNIGYVIGPGRGSAAGSLVCYVLGITNIDPIKYGLLFERFLNPERVSMPDIDTDFANGYRDIAVKYVSKKYGENAVCRIVTEGTLAARGAIRNYARIASYFEGNDETEYNYWGDKLARMIPLKPHETIANHLDELKSVAGESKEALDIIEKASLIEGCKIQYGMHAAGVIISDNNDVSDYVSLMLDESSGNWKCQCDMVQAEERGLLKMDFLGLRNLNIITDTLRLILKKRGIRINVDKDILSKIDVPVIKSICATGKTNSIFQLESGGMKEMLKKFKPDCFEDLILLVAAYRPGPMDYIPQMIEVKQGRAPLTFTTPELEDILKNTYGCIIYQEQVQQIFQKLAGYSLGQADLVRRAMSKKKEKILLAEREAFIHGDVKRNIPGCVANGINEMVANDLFDSMIEFAKYAFNKSHAAAYATITYITAWLKYYYTAEYLSVSMKYADIKKIPGLIEECNSYGIKVLPVDVNESLDTFDVNENEIRFGIISIKGIGNIDYILKARKQRKFVSFTDYILRGHFDKSVTENLIKVGAFDSFCNNRKALLTAFDVMQKYAKAIKDISKKIESTEKKLEILKTNAPFEVIKVMLTEAGIKVGKTLPVYEKVEEQLNKYYSDLKEAKRNLSETVIPVELDENYEERLEEEKELLGVYLTGHPLDAYEPCERAIKISELKSSKRTTIAGILKNVRITNRRSDNAEMAFFTLEDKTGEIRGICFAAKFAECKESIYEGAVVIMNGSVNETENEREIIDDNGEMTVENEKVFEFFCNSCIKASKKRRDIIVTVPSIIAWADKYMAQVQQFCTTGEEGYHVVIHDKLFNEMRSTNLYVNKDILNYMECFVA